MGPRKRDAISGPSRRSSRIKEKIESKRLAAPFLVADLINNNSEAAEEEADSPTPNPKPAKKPRAKKVSRKRPAEDEPSDEPDPKRVEVEDEGGAEDEVGIQTNQHAPGDDHTRRSSSEEFHDAPEVPINNPARPEINPTAAREPAWLPGLVASIQASIEDSANGIHQRTDLRITRVEELASMTNAENIGLLQRSQNGLAGLEATIQISIQESADGVFQRMDQRLSHVENALNSSNAEHGKRFQIFQNSLAAIDNNQRNIAMALVEMNRPSTPLVGPSADQASQIPTPGPAATNSLNAESTRESPFIVPDSGYPAVVMDELEETPCKVFKSLKQYWLAKRAIDKNQYRRVLRSALEHMNDEDVYLAITAISEAVNDSNMPFQCSLIDPDFLTWLEDDNDGFPGPLNEALRAVRPGQKLLFPCTYGERNSGHTWLVEADMGRNHRNRPEGKLTFFVSDVEKLNKKQLSDGWSRVERMLDQTRWSDLVVELSFPPEIHPDVGKQSSATNPTQPDFCRLHCIINAWVRALRLTLNEEFQPTDEFYRESLSIVNLAYAGSIDFLTLYTFLICYGVIKGPEDENSHGRSTLDLSQRTMVFRDVDELSRRYDVIWIEEVERKKKEEEREAFRRQMEGTTFQDDTDDLFEDDVEPEEEPDSPNTTRAKITSYGYAVEDMNDEELRVFRRTLEDAGVDL
ncbi:hypothetical protein EJ08DRAFT_718717 [Tothia fuscella]|uniref:Uncharacterized protein n=1 Tax=Tothia fuscella TaxID=1048955 RepID=A0A9P4NPG8_9PEZI|nr:hypothetical protein EJ08DRAFT_718717 [Tothia fuscella]